MSTHLDNRDRYERITGDRTTPWHPEWLLPDHYPTDTCLPFDVAMFRARHVAEPRITEGPTIRPTLPEPAPDDEHASSWWAEHGPALVIVGIVGWCVVRWLY